MLKLEIKWYNFNHFSVIHFCIKFLLVKKKLHIKHAYFM